MSKTLLMSMLIAGLLQFGSVSVHAQDNIGFSYLGICHKLWPCDQGIAAYKNKGQLRLSFLYDRTFGDDCSCVRAMYSDPREKITRIHLTNGPGLKNQRLQPEEVFYGETVRSAQEKIINNDALLKKRFQEIAARAQKDLKASVGLNHFYVSTCLECNFEKAAREILIDWAKPYFPDAQFVDNPLIDSCLEGYVCERHGRFPKVTSTCIVDLDGSELIDSEKNKRAQQFSNCIANFLWIPKFNLNDSLTTSFQAPRLRSSIPSEADFMKVQ